jgi:hypothetical protein
MQPLFFLHHLGSDGRVGLAVGPHLPELLLALHYTPVKEIEAS